MVCDVSVPRLYTDQSEAPYSRYSIYGHTPKNSNSSHIGTPHLKHVSSRASFKRFTSTQHHLQATRLHGGITVKTQPFHFNPSFLYPTNPHLSHPRSSTMELYFQISHPRSYTTELYKIIFISLIRDPTQRKYTLYLHISDNR